jgi:hypothetical protein
MVGNQSLCQSNSYLKKEDQLPGLMTAAEKILEHKSASNTPSKIQYRETLQQIAIRADAEPVGMSCLPRCLRLSSAI